MSGSSPQAAPRDRLLPDLLDVGPRLMGWYRAEARDLPWRHTRDPYAILVSEIMLQQTRVETVRERYREFLSRFPTFESLAAADVEDVLAEWSGLGYYRRARALHEAAREVVADHGGELPEGPQELRRLPGVGPYTAAAVASIAFDAPVLALDGNVARVLCRLAAIPEDPRRGPVQRRLRELASPLLASQLPGDLNQALMELGATLCAPRNPRCEACPCARACAARAAGIQDEIPPSQQETVREVEEAAAVIRYEERFLLFKGQRPSVLGDMWEFPTLDSRLAGPDGSPRERLWRHLRDLGWKIEIGVALGEIRHGITNRRIRCRVFRGALLLEDRTPAPTATCDAPESGWFTQKEAASLPLAASARKIFEQLLQT